MTATVNTAGIHGVRSLAETPVSLEMTILTGDCRETLLTLPSESVQCCVTSPPYWGLRDYGHSTQIGLEKTPAEYVAALVSVFREVRRLLKSDGTLWLNLGDSYSRDPGKGGSGPGNKGNCDNGLDEARRLLGENRDSSIEDGLKPKDLVGIPWRVAFALQADGWYLRSDIIWAKPNPMPESVTDRPTKSHEYIFLLTKNERYYYDSDSISEPTVCNHVRGPALHPDLASTNGNGGLSRRQNKETRNKRSVWTIPLSPYSGAHFATYPSELITPCILAGSRYMDTILDPFGGSGTTAKVAIELGRNAILCELNPKYVEIINQRTNVTPGMNI